MQYKDYHTVDLAGGNHTVDLADWYLGFGIHQGTTPLGSVLGLEKGLWLSLGVQVLFRLHQGADLDRFVLGSGNGLWLCSGSMLSKDAHLHAFSHGLFYVEFYSTGLLDLVGAGGLCS
ncbi:hypothetical protein R6Q59_016107 [Mikania micrantha]